MKQRKARTPSRWHPGLGLRTRPRKLLQSVAQGFDTRIATMRLARVAALVGDGRRASPRLQTGRFRRACAISADLGEQARSQSLAGAGQTAEDEVCFRHQKKALNPLIIALPATSKGARPIFVNRSRRVEQVDFRLARLTVHMSKSTACSGPLSSGLVQSFL